MAGIQVGRFYHFFLVSTYTSAPKCMRRSVPCMFDQDQSIPMPHNITNNSKCKFDHLLSKIQGNSQVKSQRTSTVRMSSRW